MKKVIYTIVLSVVFAVSGVAQTNMKEDKKETESLLLDNSTENKTVDMGMYAVVEGKKTQAISTVYSDELEKNSVVSPYNALYGLLPGLSVMQNTAWDTEKSRLNIRGRGS